MKKLLILIVLFIGSNAYSQNYFLSSVSATKDTLSCTAADTSRSFYSSVTGLQSFTIEYRNNSIPKTAVVDISTDYGIYRIRTVAGDSTLVVEGASDLTGGWVRLPLKILTSQTPAEKISLTWSGTMEVAIRGWRYPFQVY